MKDKMINDVITLKNVRLTFPNLYEFEMFKGERGKKYSATFLLDKVEHAALIAKINTRIKAMVEKIKVEKMIQIKDDNIGFRDADKSIKKYEGFKGCYSMKGSSYGKFTIIDGQRNTVTEEDAMRDHKFYAGCYVDAKIQLVHIAANDYLNAKLLGIQFRKNGAELSMSLDYVDADEFEVYPDDEEAVTEALPTFT